MKYKLGDTVRVALPAVFEPEQEPAWYFDEDGRPCDKYGNMKYVNEYALVTIETQEELDYFNTGSTNGRAGST